MKGQINRAALQSAFVLEYGTAPPQNMSQSLMALAIGYRQQEKVAGGLSPALRRRLLEGKTEPPQKACAGTILMREWRGVRHTVTVHSEYVEYQGRKCGSLSEVARLITGQRRSGPAFFGLARHGQ